MNKREEKTSKRIKRERADMKLRTDERMSRRERSKGVILMRGKEGRLKKKDEEEKERRRGRGWER